METVSSIYGEFVTSTRFESLDPETVQQTKKVILDLIGVSLAGYQAMAFPKMVVDYFVEMGGKAEATVIQGKKKLPSSTPPLPMRLAPMPLTWTTAIALQLLIRVLS